MRNLILLLILFAFQGGKKLDYVSIEYAGDSNKPVDIIYLSRDSIPRPERIGYFEYSGPPFDYIVSQKDLQFVKNAMRENSMSPFKDEDYHGFRITLRENNSVSSYFIVDKRANPFFKSLINHFKTYKKYDDLILLINVHQDHVRHKEMK